MELIITDNDTKLELLKANNNVIHDYKFMSKNEFFSSLNFKYDYKTVLYLMKKNHSNIDIVINILDSLKNIDQNKKYNSSKLNYLSEIKKDLLDNKLLYFNKDFKNYLKRFEKIEFINVFLEKYELDLIKEIDNTKIVSNDVLDKEIAIYKYETFEDEVIGVCIEILKLLDSGVDIEKIVLTNVSDDDNFIIERIFNLFNIPISLNKKLSIYNSNMIKEYLKNYDLSEVTDRNILEKLTSVLNNTVELKDDSKEYRDLLIYLLKRTYLDNVEYKNSIKIKDFDTSFKDDEYVFIMSFNNDLFPKYVKDDEYLSDKDKEEISMYKSYEKNEIIKNNTVNKIKTIRNVILSYHLYNSRDMYISNIYKELNLVIKNPEISYSYSNKFNKIKLSEMLDEYYNYNVLAKDLFPLYNTYGRIYNSYDNAFDGINKDDYIDYIKKPLTISFSSLDNYNLCRFKYYVNNVLKLDKYEETFSIFIGNLFHYLLSLASNENFNYEREWDNFISKRELTSKEEVLLSFIKDDFKKLLDNLCEIMSNTEFKDSNYEVLIEEKLEKDVDVIFKGIVDKIMVYQNMNDTYFAVIDYKTYDKKLSLDNINIGIDMQLPIYIYLISKSNLFKNPIFAGMFYQKVLNSSREKTTAQDLKLVGYTTDNISILEKLDKTYSKSNLIKSLTFSNENGFGAFSKVLSDDEVYNLNAIVKKVIDEKIDDILDAKFMIDPKKQDKENISCKYCKYCDLCFVKAKDVIELDSSSMKDYLDNE